MNKRQRAAAELLVLHPEMKDKDICEKLLMSQTSLSGWKKKPEFQEYMEKIREENWKDATLKAQQNMQQMMNSDNENIRYKANEYVLNSAGYNKQQIEIEAARAINITVDIKDNECKD